MDDSFGEEAKIRIKATFKEEGEVEQAITEEHIEDQAHVQDSSAPE